MTTFLSISCVVLLAALAVTLLALYNTRREVTDLQEQLKAVVDEANRRLTEAVVPKPGIQEIAEKQPDTPAPTKNEAATHPLYLARCDEQGRFVRVTEQFEPGNSIFSLIATGKNGTFTLIDRDDVRTHALMMPTHNLGRACSGVDLTALSPASRITTIEPGKATYHDGNWLVSSPARLSLD